MPTLFKLQEIIQGIGNSLPEVTREPHLETLRTQRQQIQRETESQNVFESIDFTELPTGKDQWGVLEDEPPPLEDEWRPLRGNTPSPTPPPPTGNGARGNEVVDWEALGDDEYRNRDPAAFGPCPQCDNLRLWRYYCARCEFGS